MDQEKQFVIAPARLLRRLLELGIPVPRNTFAAQMIMDARTLPLLVSDLAPREAFWKTQNWRRLRRRAWKRARSAGNR